MPKLEPAAWWSVRAAHNLKPATYRCPLCGELLYAMSEHMLIAPEGNAERRRHAHTDCVLEARKAGRLPPGWEYRLPTEAQWEYACRAGTQTAYSFGDDESRLGDFAWYGDNSAGRTHEVGQKLPNAWGLRDMHGNVWEWCSDSYQETLVGGTDPQFAERASGRVYRGGSGIYSGWNCRSASRSGYTPGFRYRLLGVRVALVQSR